ncbi:ROK family transcriptional regulator [Conexibacter woesei]|uniref:ROK family protein n=1 Tax=Conexibacter woesei (strain DSM 14684 / CCUG 47730 / CIP 108061 / JCM 11494 / NBRC 100937 / ID131577) TaxID=469383 RepID=D3FCB2_CONWI|nr:ROK family transcriptional regulator [Conexibacter woesei]ADB53407.1 ROK family protein [Conexibacter woesei DSM 14684]
MSRGPEGNRAARAIPRPGGGQQPGTPSLLRTINERSLLDLLRREGSMSRPELARETGLSKPTVSLALGKLEAAGLVREAGRHSHARGRAAVVYEPETRAGFVLGVDIGREFVRVAVADLAGVVVARRDARNGARSAASVVRAVERLAREVVDAAGLAWVDIVHTVVGSPGTFDAASGRMLLAPNLPGWGRRGLVEDLRRVLSPSLAVENDANLAALGERSYGHGADADTFVFITLGTGVGMGIVLDGELYAGAHGMAGEIGFLPLSGDPGSPPDRVRGMVEDVLSAEGVVRSARELGMTGVETAKEIFAAARRGDELALRTVEREGERLALIVAAVAAIVDPQLVVLGGGIGTNFELLRGALERELERITPLRTRVVDTMLGEDAVVLGAIATGLDVAHELVFEQRTTGVRVAAARRSGT